MDARSRILARLHAARSTPVPDAGLAPGWTPPRYGDRRLAQWTDMITAAHGEVHLTDSDHWPDVLRKVLVAKSVGSLLYAPSLQIGQQLARHWETDPRPPHPHLVPYDQPIEGFRSALIDKIDAAITSCRGAIAQTGSLILWPTRDEPRLMSLLPPIHCVLLSEDAIFESFSDALAGQDWAQGMPTNALLISGPSKTADIEQTLAYGVHGPKELIVLVIRKAVVEAAQG